MPLINDYQCPLILSVPIFLTRIDNFLFDKPKYQKHLSVRYYVIFISKQTLEIEIYQSRIRFKRGRRVPYIRIPAVYEFL